MICCFAGIKKHALRRAIFPPFEYSGTPIPDFLLKVGVV
nr:MAG TPA: hypothetical protein [Bacteriophage sp.]